MKPSVTVVSLGPGDPDLLNAKTILALKESENLVLRTGMHPLSGWLEKNAISFDTLDSLYNSAEDFDQLNQSIADFLWARAKKAKVVYAVHDASLDRSVHALFRTKPAEGSVEVIPGLSGFDCHVSSTLDFLPDLSLYVISAYDLQEKEPDPSISLLITELDNPLLAGEVKRILSDRIDDSQKILLLNGFSRHVIPLYELDRQKSYDHMTSVLVPATDYMHRSRYSIHDLKQIMDRLRAPDGCPWDRAQTHASLTPYVVEEAWECVDCIDQNDMPHLADELGDLLFQIVFHASIGSSFDEFTLTDIISLICAKMLRRHPHVFPADPSAETGMLPPDWEKIKQAETGSKTPLESLADVSKGLPSLKYASKSIRKLEQIPAMRRSISAVLTELKNIVEQLENTNPPVPENMLGSLLLLCAELCFRCQSDSELLLHRTVDRLKKRLEAAEKLVKKDGKSLESLTFTELGVYLRHVEGEIE